MSSFSLMCSIVILPGQAHLDEALCHMHAVSLLGARLEGLAGCGCGRETEASSNLSLTLTGTCLAMLIILRALGARVTLKLCLPRQLLDLRRLAG